MRHSTLMKEGETDRREERARGKDELCRWQKKKKRQEMEGLGWVKRQERRGEERRGRTD